MIARFTLVAAALAACSSSGPKPADPVDPDDTPPADAACQGDACVEPFRAFLRRSPPDFAAADTFATAACDRGVEVMCIRVGRINALPLYPESDPKKALAAFEKSCKRGAQTGCLGVAKIIMVYPALGATAGGPARAGALFQSACDGGVGQGCYHIGMRYYFGQHVPADQAKAVAMLAKRIELLTASCERGDGDDCGTLSRAYGRGEHIVGGKISGVPDAGRAREYARKGCDAKDGESCLALGRLELSGDEAAAAELFARGCEMLDADACAMLAKHGASDAEKPRLLERACQLGGGSGCYALAEVSGLGADPDTQAKSRSLQARGCELGYPPSCRLHANMVLRGHGGPADPNAARERLIGICNMIHTGTFCGEPECILAINSSCADAGVMLRDGIGGPADAERGAELLKLACERGLDLACKSVGIEPGSGAPATP